MNEYYNEWIEKEKEWSKPLYKRLVKITGIIILIELFFLFYLSVSSENLMSGIVTFLPMMIFVIFYMIIFYVLQNRIYIKRIKKALKNSIPNEKEQINFMKEILAMSENSPRKLNFSNGRVISQIICTQDYYYMKSGKHVELVPFYNIESVEADEIRDLIHTPYFRFRNHFYVIRLYYKGNKRKQGDVVLHFSDVRIRDIIINLIQNKINGNDDVVPEILKSIAELPKPSKSEQLLKGILIFILIIFWFYIQFFH